MIIIRDKYGNETSGWDIVGMILFSLFLFVVLPLFIILFSFGIAGFIKQGINFLFG
jgi:hypothetical protein